VPRCERSSPRSANAEIIASGARAHLPLASAHLHGGPDRHASSHPPCHPDNPFSPVPSGGDPQGRRRRSTAAGPAAGSQAGLREEAGRRGERLRKESRRGTGRRTQACTASSDIFWPKLSRSLNSQEEWRPTGLVVRIHKRPQASSTGPFVRHARTSRRVARRPGYLQANTEAIGRDHPVSATFTRIARAMRSQS